MILPSDPSATNSEYLGVYQYLGIRMLTTFDQAVYDDETTTHQPMVD